MSRLARLSVSRIKPWFSAGAGCYLLAALMMVPVWWEPTIRLPGTVQDTMFVIDISESMNVPDAEFPSPRTPRLELAKVITRASMASLDCGSRVSLALFAGEQVVVLFEPLEICRHYSAIDQVVERLTTHMRWIGDSRIETGLTEAIKEAGARNLGVVFVTDGDEMPHRSSPRLTLLENLRGQTKGLIVAVGGEVPLPVPRVDGSGQVMGYWSPVEAVREGFHPNLLGLVETLQSGEQAPDGMLDEVGEHLSAAQPAYLELLSGASGLAFAHAHHPRDVLALIDRHALTEQANAERDARWIFGCVAAGLFLMGWFWQGVMRVIHARVLQTIRQGWAWRRAGGSVEP